MTSWLPEYNGDQNAMGKGDVLASLSTCHVNLHTSCDFQNAQRWQTYHHHWRYPITEVVGRADPTLCIPAPSDSRCKRYSTGNKAFAWRGTDGPFKQNHAARYATSLGSTDCAPIPNQTHSSSHTKKKTGWRLLSVDLDRLGIDIDDVCNDAAVSGNTNEEKSHNTQNISVIEADTHTQTHLT